VAVFASHLDHEHAVSNGHFIGTEASVFLRRFDKTDQRFIFEHESVAAISISRFPFEHWQRQHISHSSGPYANPPSMIPFALLELIYRLSGPVTVKAETITSIPMNLAIKNY
jgi:hypothetical protein